MFVSPVSIVAASQAVRLYGAVVGMTANMLQEPAAPVEEVAEPTLARTQHKTFEVGVTYWDRSTCDYDCIFKIKVVRRTAKTIFTECGKTLRVSEWQGVETVKPHGSYSMCSVMSADKRFE